MKIRIMTFHTPKNYGAVLQAYALQTYLKSICDDVKVIDYNTPALKKAYPLINKPSSIKEAILSIISILHLPRIIKKYGGFESFLKQYFDLTERYTSTEKLYCNPPDCDILITGSDQVFNTNRRMEERKAFYLDFGREGTKVVSYAASFGISNISRDNQHEILSYLNKFDSLSVREASGVGIIKTLSGKDAIEVLDPVFLLDNKMWLTVCEEYKSIPKKYLLYYRLLNTINGDRIAEEIAKKLGLEIVVITDSVQKKVNSRYILRDVGPDQFLGLYANSSFVVTNSFHGTAFSIIFKKQFFNCDENKGTQDRPANLLKKLGLEDRMQPTSVDELLSEKIDYEKVYERLKDYIVRSKDFLKTVTGNNI